MASSNHLSTPTKVTLKAAKEIYQENIREKNNSSSITTRSKCSVNIDSETEKIPAILGEKSANEDENLISFALLHVYHAPLRHLNFRGKSFCALLQSYRTRSL